jgi:hypothetical protein
METEMAARLTALEAAQVQLRDDLAAVVDIVAKLVDEAIGQPAPGQLDGAEVTLAQLQRRFIEARRQLEPADRPAL